MTTLREKFQKEREAAADAAAPKKPKSPPAEPSQPADTVHEHPSTSKKRPAKKKKSR